MTDKTKVSDGKKRGETAKAVSDVPLYDMVDYQETKVTEGKPEASLHDYSTVSVATMNRETVYAEVAAASIANINNQEIKINKTKWIFVVTVFVGIIMLIFFFGIFVAVFLQLADLKSSHEQLYAVMAQLQQVNESLSRKLKETANSQDSIIQQLNSSIDLITEQSSVSRQINASVRERLEEFENIEDIQDSEIRQLNMLVSNINTFLAGQFSFNPATSCAALPPSSPSGYYWVRASNGSAVGVYCDMTRSCGGVTRGWRRVAELDMTNSSHQCPSGLRQRTDSNKRTCVRNSYSAGCSSVTISTATVGYSRVCGKIIGYQFGDPNSFFDRRRTIDTLYVDGVSLTHGYPRQHIWTFAAEYSSCPCSQPSSLVGSDYFCDGSNGVYAGNRFYSDNPLWDGDRCLNSCCSFNNPPWFSKQLPQPTTDDIDMRVCRDQDAYNEDVAVEMVEIYVY